MISKPDQTVITHWKHPFIAKKRIPLSSRALSWKLYSALTPSITSMPIQTRTEDQKYCYLFLRWGNRSKEELRDPFPKAGKQFKGWRISRNTWKYRSTWKNQNKGVICLSAPIQGVLWGGSRTDYQINRGCWRQRWREMSLFTSSWANLSTACKTHDYYGITRITFGVYSYSYLKHR